MKILSNDELSEVQLDVGGVIFQKIVNIFCSIVAFKKADGRMSACLHEQTSSIQSKTNLKKRIISLTCNKFSIGSSSFKINRFM